MVVSSLMTKLRKDEDEKSKKASVEECTALQDKKCFLLKINLKCSKKTDKFFNKQNQLNVQITPLYDLKRNIRNIGIFKGQ